MSTDEIRWRAISSKSGVPQWYIETGQWRQNEDMVTKVRAAMKSINEIRDKKLVTHFHVGNKNIDQVISIIRRWYYKNVKPGQPCIIAYDYLKLTLGDSVEKNWGEYQVLGEKIDRLKRLAEELNCVIVTAIQLNRSGENHNKKSVDVADDSTAIAITDRLQWLAAFVAIFRRKTLDEMMLDGPEFGTHKLVPLKTRFQGRDAAGHHDLVKRIDLDGKQRYVNNYLNFSVTNFDVAEMGSLRDIVALEAQKYNLDDKNKDDGHTL
jgi:replicative DNA helicase